MDHATSIEWESSPTAQFIGTSQVFGGLKNLLMMHYIYISYKKKIPLNQVSVYKTF